MYPQNGYSQVRQLPYRTDVWDENTINRSLPHGNDTHPPVQQFPISIAQEDVNLVVGKWRQLLQSRLGNTPLHTFTYNVLSDQFFNNQTFCMWLQRTLDFIDLLVVGAGQPAHLAIEKAVGKMYRGALATIASEFPELFSEMPPQGQQDLIAAGKELDRMMVDLDEFLRNGRRPPHQPQVGYGQSQMGGYGYRQPQLNPLQAGLGQMAGGARLAGAHQGHAVGAKVTSPPTKGRYGESWDARSPTETTPKESVSQAVVEEDGFKAIQDKEQIIFDPGVYVPKGVEIDENRPYDVIYAPGGVEARPFHLSPWKRTKGDLTPYPTAYDPTLYCLYHVHWPDGLVEEQLVEWKPNMDYLKHEINDELRGAKVKPDGKVVASTINILKLDSSPVPIEQLIPKDDRHLSKADLKPVILDGVFAASSRLENEMAARDMIIEQLKLDPHTDYVPAHEYISVQVHPLDVETEGWERLVALSDADSLPAVARGLNEALNDGVLPLRLYRLINERLTRAVNKCLTENLSLDDIAIDSFAADMQELYDYLRDEKGMPETVEAFVTRTRPLLRRVLNLREESIAEDEEESEVERFLVDESINLQLSWSHEELGSLNMGSEPALLSTTTHPRVHRVVSDLIKRHGAAKTLDGRYVRLITCDGVYLEVITGWLVDASLLLKYAD